MSIFKNNNIIGWRRNLKIRGKPDFVFRHRKIVVFVDGCFWHGHRCRNTEPKDNDEYWRAKIGGNKKRDEEITAFWEKKGWKVIRIWECELKNKNREKLIEKLDPFSI
jgi:DNA mismatch endonuclease (patch repair protein)